MTWRSAWQAVVSAFDHEAAASGMDRCEKGIYAVGLSDDMIGWIGLNDIPEPAGVRINPVIGVRSTIVENFIAAALGRRITKTYLPVTFARNFGYFQDQRRYRTFSFQTKDRDLQARVGEMASEVLRTAHALWHRHTDLRAVADSLEAVATGPYLTRAPRIAVARFLLGDLDGMARAVDRGLKEAERDGTELGEEFRQLATFLERRVSQG